MKQTILTLLAIVLFVFLLVASVVLPRQTAYEEAVEHGVVKELKQCIFDKGPYWAYGKNTPVYYVQYENGRNAYIAVTMFGVKFSYDD